MLYHGNYIIRESKELCCLDGDSGKSEILRAGLESTTDLSITSSDARPLSYWIFVKVTPLN